MSHKWCFMIIYVKVVKMNPNHQHRAHTYEQAEEKPNHMNKSKGKIPGDSNAVDEDE